MTLMISQAAKKVDMTINTIRHYIDLGLIKPKRDPENGYQLFNTTDIQRLNFIKLAKQLGFTLKEIQQMVVDAEKGDSPCPRVRKIIEQRLEENNQKIKELQNMQHRMEKALVDWATMSDGQPDGHSVCSLIESQ